MQKFGRTKDQVRHTLGTPPKASSSTHWLTGYDPQVMAMAQSMKHNFDAVGLPFVFTEEAIALERNAMPQSPRPPQCAPSFSRDCTAVRSDPMTAGRRVRASGAGG